MPEEEGGGGEEEVCTTVDIYSVRYIYSYLYNV